MKVLIDGLPVYFPHPSVYPEQASYMEALKKTLDDGGGHCLVEMPTGTGKTAALLSLITSYQMKYPQVGKLIYCTRTVQEMDKVMAELKQLIDQRAEDMKSEGLVAPDILAVCLSSRRNMCIHPEVSKYSDRDSVDSMCRSLTASWVRESPNTTKCDLFEALEGDGLQPGDMTGIWALDDVKAHSRQRGWCPYFLALRLINLANVVVFNYQYLLNPKIARVITRSLDKDCVVVFDEAHNIDNICVEALSVKIDHKVLRASIGNIKQLNQSVSKLQREDAERLQTEYNKLLAGLNLSEASQEVGVSDVAFKDIQMRIPGNIRKARNFLVFLRSFVEHLMTKLSSQSMFKQTPTGFLSEFQRVTSLPMNQVQALKYCYERLISLLHTLKISDSRSFSPIMTVCDLGTLAATYEKGFVVLMEPHDTDAIGIQDPVMQLCCLDASIGMKPIVEKYRNVVITSGTLSPIDFYPTILSFAPKISETFSMILSRNAICPLIVTKGNDQTPLSSKFDLRNDTNVISNYGHLLLDLAKVVPDGIVCFFTSYRYMQNTISEWNNSKLLDKVLAEKLIFIETQDIVETTLALESYKKACDCGRGAIFFSVGRGKVAEGIDFDSHYGRCVILFGIPFRYSRSNALLSRLDFLKSEFHISEHDFLAFDALRQAAQCAGRVIRSKKDYGLMIFADQRYSRIDKRRKLPLWIRQYIQPEHINMSSDRAVAAARRFFKDMAQPMKKAVRKRLPAPVKADTKPDVDMKDADFSSGAPGTGYPGQGGSSSSSSSVPPGNFHPSAPFGSQGGGGFIPS